jgi:cytochrome c biogenesis protein CcdA
MSAPYTDVRRQMTYKHKVWFSLLSVLMLVPCYFSVISVYYFHTGTIEQYKSENLIVIAFMAVYSLVLALPYIISLAIFRKILEKKFIISVSTPFFIMLVITVYGTYLGIPW